MQKPRDIVGEITGEWGPWQLRTVLLIFLCKIPSAWFMACIIFTAPLANEGEYYCKPPNGMEIDNKTTWIQQIHPAIEISSTDGPTFDFCHIYGNFRDKLTHRYHYLENQSDPFTRKKDSSIRSNVLPCEIFEHDSMYNSLVTQFDLVCSRKILIAWTQFWHLFGVLMGGILATILLESLSPRRVMVVGMVTQIFCGCLTGLVNTYNLHVFFRFLSAVCCAQMYTAGQVIFADITGGNYRKSVICLFESFWGIGVMILPVLSYFLQNWSYIYLGISLPTLFYIILWHWIPDSPRWLLKHGLVDEARDVLLMSAETNNRKYTIPYEFEKILQEKTMELENAPTPLGWWSLWTDSRAILTMIALHTAWAAYVTNYNGMLLNIRAFGRDYIYVNTAVAGFAEIVGVLIAWFFVMKTQYKWMWTGLFNIAAGILSCFGFFIPTSLPEPVSVALVMVTAMVAKSATTCSQTFLVTTTGELVSPLKQRICVFSCVVWARIWLLTAPFIGVITFIHYLAPLVAFGQIGLVGGIATCLICLISNRQSCSKSDGSNNKPEICKPDIWTTEITKL